MNEGAPHPTPSTTTSSATAAPPPAAPAPVSLAPLPAGAPATVLCEWARGALAARNAPAALRAWGAAGHPLAAEPQVATTFSFLEAEVGDWPSVAARTRGVLERQPDNPLAGGLAAIAAWKTHDYPRALDLFRTFQLFAAYPLVRLFVYEFAPVVRDRPEIFAATPAARTATAAAAAAPPAKPSTTAESAQPTGMMTRLSEVAHATGGSGNARAAIRRGERALSQGDLATAALAFREAATADSTDPMPALLAGWCRMESGDREGAADDLFRLLEAFPEQPPVVSGAAWAAWMTGDARLALHLTATLKPAGPDDWSLHYLAALSLKSLQQDQEADDALQQALGPFFLDTWELWVQPLHERVVSGLEQLVAAPNAAQPAHPPAAAPSSS